MNPHIAGYYAKHYNRINKDISRRVGHNDSEDLTQEVFLRICKSYKTFDKSKGNFNSWVGGIIRGVVADFRRNNNRYNFIVSEETIRNRPNKEPHYEDNSVEAQEQIEKVESKISKKKRPTRDILYLNIIMGMTTKEISEFMKIPRRTVSQTIYRFNSEVS